MSDLLVTTQTDVIVEQVELPAEIIESADQTVVLEVAQQGLPGRDGRDGVDGTGGDLSYVHTQGVAMSTWTIPHNLGKYPSITVVDSAGDEVEGDVNYGGLNTAIVRFSAPFSGTAYCN